jgi:predicted alpha/beta superfamily hydrolase
MGVRGWTVVSIALILSCAKRGAVSESRALTPAGEHTTESRAVHSVTDRPATANAPEAVARLGAKSRYASAILKEEREYWVDLPDGYDARSGATSRYPVLYLLDAERFFAAAASTVKFMSQLGTIPEMIVVGIPSTKTRTRDMTPTHSLKGPNGEPTQRGATSGGADSFLSSLQTELISAIEARYRTMAYRVLVGHSLSGLFALHAFVQDPTLFHAVIAMDPSLWWDDQLLARRAATQLSSRKNLRNSVYIGTAKDTSASNRSPKAATQAFYQAIRSLPSAHLRSKLQPFEDEDHQTVSLPSFYYGLSFIFEHYAVPPDDAVSDPAALVAHYRQFSEKRGVVFEPPEAAFAMVAWVLLFDQKKVDEAILVLEENVRRHPSSPQAHDYLGQAYLAKGDKAAAIRSFERVLQLKPGDEDATEQLKNLRAN